MQVALGELAGAAKEGLLALSVGVGVDVLSELMEEELTGRRPEGQARPRAQRCASRARVGRGDARRPAVSRSSVPGRGAPTASRRWRFGATSYFADRDPLTRLVLEQMLAGVSTRRFERTREPVGEQVEAEARSVSKSAVSREFVKRTRENSRR